MPADSPLPIPTSADGLLAWLMANPNVIQDALRAVNLLLALEVNIVAAGGYNTQKQSLVVAAQNIVLPIPLKLANPLTSPTTTVGAAVASTGASQTTPWGYTTAAQANDIVSRLNQIRVDVLALNASYVSLLAALRTTGQLPT